MKTEASRPALPLLALVLLACSLTACKIPPRYAMREIQSKGLFIYLSTDYSNMPQGYWASSAPFQLQRPQAQPRPVNRVPYRSTYDSNRHLVANLDSPASPASAAISAPAAAEMSLDSPTPLTGSAASASATVPAKTQDAAAIAAPNVSLNQAAATKPEKSDDNLPYGTPVTGRPGMVISPYTDASKKQLVDVTGLPVGEKVKDPYTGKLFRVPPTVQAENKPAAATEEKPAKSTEGQP